ncbi:MAG TPA: hypothetical protein VM118_10815 [Acidobacteriota bacterium]|nr:hypothetical protein [Acidobacteriota bacterium]
MFDGDMLRPVVMVLVVLTFAIIAKGATDYLSRRQLLARGATPEDLDGKAGTARDWHLMSNLKWALVCIGFGLAVIFYDHFSDSLSTTGGFGIMFLGAGLGYLCYFLVAWRWSRKGGKD